jgi:hypothetical protein
MSRRACGEVASRSNQYTIHFWVYKKLKKAIIPKGTDFDLREGPYQALQKLSDWDYQIPYASNSKRNSLTKLDEGKD